jgi:hypothetical protein
MHITKTITTICLSFERNENLGKKGGVGGEEE